MMQGSAQKEHSYLVHHFKMGSVDGTYSNIAFSKDEDSAGNMIHSCGCMSDPGHPTSLRSGGPCQCTATRKREIFYGKVDGNEGVAIDKKNGDYSEEVHSPWFALYDRYNVSNGKSRGKDKNNSATAVESNGGVYVNLTNKQQYSARKGTWHQEQSGKRKQQPDPGAAGISAGTQQHVLSSQCSGSTRLIAFLQVLTFFMAAASLALVILMINGTIVCSDDSVRGMIKEVKSYQF